LPDWLTWQERLHPVGIDMGLDRCRAVAMRMGLDHIGSGVITVAGTNGKGSSVALLEAIYAAAGYRVASYTSPHLRRYNERIRLDREPVDDARICAAFQQVDEARNGTSLTYFEFGTLAAFTLFNEAKPDVCILEVGLGGRLDAVNLIDADVALISAIDLDHQDLLGATRAEIAREKAGIMRPGKPAVCSDPDAPPTLAAMAAATGCPLRRLGVDFHFECHSDSWDWWNAEQQWLALPSPALAGPHQYRNAAGVLQAVVDFTALPIAEPAIRQGLRTMHVPGRFQLIPGAIEYRLDVAHNPAAAQVLAETARAGRPVGKTHVIFGIMADKDSHGFIATLDPVVDEWHIVTLPGTRAATASNLAVACRRLPGQRKSISTYESMAAACAAVASRTKPGDRVIVTGSHYAVSEFLAVRDDESSPALLVATS
jgi:dihydrofolate synthase/folylpolyglutamate synthase